jgi:3-methyladenine DNA glycosylase AlkD
VSGNLLTAEDIKRMLSDKADAQKAQVLQRFFKTGAGEYGEGDRFLGISLPEQRSIARRCWQTTPLDELGSLISTDVHEHRMTGLLMLVYAAESRSGRADPSEYVQFYLHHIDRVNNWDLVDVTCPGILGPWYWDRDRTGLLDLARSGSLWRERISVVTTLFFIRRLDFSTTFAAADILLHHRHDLIHKAVGWMLREVGKRDPTAEREFLDPRYLRMPRTMLRYAIEKFPEGERQAYLHGEIR